MKVLKSCDVHSNECVDKLMDEPRAVQVRLSSIDLFLIMRGPRLLLSVKHLDLGPSKELQMNRREFDSRLRHPFFNSWASPRLNSLRLMPYRLAYSS